MTATLATVIDARPPRRARRGGPASRWRFFAHRGKSYLFNDQTSADLRKVIAEFKNQFESIQRSLQQ